MPKKPICRRCNHRHCKCKDGISVYYGDCMDVMRRLQDESITAVVTDPPYGIFFMSRNWDHGIPGIPFWEEMLRICKPGAPLLAFGGTRTYHRLVCAIEDAGWEIRDCIMWIFGSGFPKSLDVGKAIDKRGGKEIAWFGPWFRHWRKENDISQKQVSALFPSKTGGLTGCVANWELGFNMPTCGQFNLIRDAFNLPFASLAEAEREVVGPNANWRRKKSEVLNVQQKQPPNTTTPATPEAKQWDGYGSNLKPAYETICLSMKPLDGTYAENALKHGVAGINVDGCRVGTEVLPKLVSGSSALMGGLSGNVDRGGAVTPQRVGRFPANLIHDGSDEAVAGFPDAGGGSGTYHRNKPEGRRGQIYKDYGHYAPGTNIGLGDSGSASRFFYTAKASKAERRGSKHPTVKPLALMIYLCKLVMMPKRTVILDPFCGSGTTLVAAQTLGLRAIGIEKDKQSCKDTIKRLEKPNDLGLLQQLHQ